MSLAVSPEKRNYAVFVSIFWKYMSWCVLCLSPWDIPQIQGLIISKELKPNGSSKNQWKMYCLLSLAAYRSKGSNLGFLKRARIKGKIHLFPSIFFAFGACLSMFTWSCANMLVFPKRLSEMDFFKKRFCFLKLVILSWRNIRKDCSLLVEKITFIQQLTSNVSPGKIFRDFFFL